MMDNVHIKKSASGNLRTKSSDLETQDHPNANTTKTTFATPVTDVAATKTTDGYVQHTTVTGYVMNVEHTKLLMIHHNKLNKWLPPGGHLEAGEVPHRCALREVLEETGIHARVIDIDEHDLNINDGIDAQIPRPYALLYVLIPKNEDKAEHINLDMIYALEADEDEAITMQVKEVSDVQWLTREQVLLSNETFDSVKGFAKHNLI
jgi:8-oxo-dGTP diphosphatase